MAQTYGNDLVWDASISVRELTGREVYDLPEMKALILGIVGTTENIGNLSSTSSRRLSTTIAPHKGVTTAYQINVLARNRGTSETLRVRFNQATNEWEYKSKIVRATSASGKYYENTSKTLAEDKQWIVTTIVLGQH